MDSYDHESCVVLVNVNFNKTKCADCSIRVYQSFGLSANMNKHLEEAILPFTFLYCCILFFSKAIVTN